MPANPLSVLVVTLAIMIPAAVIPAGTVRPPRTVAITIDDLPYAGQPSDLETVRQDTERILAALVAHDVPASGFVTGKSVLRPGETDERLDLLRDWRAAGMDLENHGFDHVDYVSTSIPAYHDEVAQGMVFPQRVMAETGGRVRWFRAAYNHSSPDRKKRAALVSWLADRDLGLAPFTVDHADYAWNRVYADALEREDRETLSRISREYLDHLDRAFAFAEELSGDTFGREIPQVFLIHANAIQAEHLDALLARLEERGYRFVSLQKAAGDPAYTSKDGYVGPQGLSWLHRWRIAMGKPDRLRDEPDLPGWVLEAWRSLSSSGAP